MSHTYKLITATGSLLPASYPLTLTAVQSGYSPLTTTISVTVTGQTQQPPTDGQSVRTIDELLTVIWRDGQARRQLTAQDVRDTIVTLALHTGDFSRLPRSPFGLAAGRVFVDGAVVRVNLPNAPFQATARLNGTGSVTPSEKARYHQAITLNGAGKLTAKPN